MERPVLKPSVVQPLSIAGWRGFDGDGKDLC